MSAVIWVLLGSFILSVLIIVGWIVYYKLTYKHFIRIREMGKNRKIIKDFKCKNVYKNGEHYWRIGGEHKKELRIVPVPPEECIELTSSGKKSVEAFRFPTGEISYIMDNHVFKEIPENMRDIGNDAKKLLKLKEWKEKNRVVTAFQPLETNQRAALVHNIERAQSRRRRGWMDYIVPIVGLGAMVFILVALFIFWGDLAQPLLEMKKEQNQGMQIQKETLEVIRDIKQNVQTIENEINDIKAAEEVPN